MALVWLGQCHHDAHLRVRNVTAFGILRMRGRPNPLAKALRELTPEQQRVIYLRFVAGLDTSEIAQIMGKREDDVRMLQLHALRSLLRVLAN